MRRCLSAFVVLAAFVILATPVFAGGWATVRLDEPPGELPAGVPWQFGFMVLQHDVTPNSDVTPVIHATHLESGDEVTATAEQDGPAGHFMAELTLPTAGEWSWTITPEPFAETTFPALIVGNADNGENSTDADRPIAAATPSASAETIEMTDEWLFAPGNLEITLGTTVTWMNNSSIVHSVALDDPHHTASGLLDPWAVVQCHFRHPRHLSLPLLAAPGDGGVGDGGGVGRSAPG